LCSKSVVEVLKSDPNVFFESEVDNSTIEGLTELQRAEIVSLYGNKMTIYNIAKRYNIKCTDVRLVVMQAHVKLHKRDILASSKLTDDRRIYDHIYEVWSKRLYSTSLFLDMFGVRDCDLRRAYGWDLSERVKSATVNRKVSNSKYTRVKQDVQDAIISDLIKGKKVMDIAQKFNVPNYFIHKITEKYVEETGDNILHTNRKLLNRIAHVDIKAVIAEYLDGKAKSEIQKDHNITGGDLNTVLKDQTGKPRPKWMYKTDHIDYNDVVRDRVENKMTKKEISKKYDLTVGYVECILSHNT
jgi:hypothetical protein